MSAGERARRGGPRYDDRVDTRPQLSARGVLYILRRSLPYIWPARRLFLLKFVLMVGSFTPILLAPWAIKVLVDHVVVDNPLTASAVRFPPFFQPFVDAVQGLDPLGLLLAVLAMLAALVLLFGAVAGEARGTGTFLAQGEDTATQSENLISAGWSMAGGLWGLADLLCNIRLVQRVTDALRTHLFARLLRLPMTVLDDQRIGDGIYRTMYDAPAIQGICFDLTLMPVVSVLVALVTVVTMEYSFGHVIPELMYLAMATMPVAFLFTAPLAGLARRTSQASRSAGSATTNRIEANTANVRAMQSHGVENRERAAFADASTDSFRRYRGVVAVNIGIEAMSGLALLSLGAWAFLLVSDRVIAGELLPGDFLVVLGYFGAVAGSSITFGRLWVDFQNNAAGVRRVFFLIDLPNDDDLPGSAPAPGRALERIVFDDVGLVYPDGRRALDGVSFEARVGQQIAIVGPTGAGKTSLAYLIPGFLAPTSGRVGFAASGGPLVDARDIDVDALRAQTAYVFQEHLLFAGTVERNLRLGRPQASEAELERAARISGAHDFVTQLADGYDTHVGRDGALSVGQKQRLSIARGLVRDTPVLILDEPTAALDPDSEQALVRTLARIKSERIVLVIAHRLSTIASSDLILFMDEGRIVEQGSHEALMAVPDGAYRRFVEVQQGE